MRPMASTLRRVTESLSLLAAAALASTAIASCHEDHDHGKTANATAVTGSADTHCGTKVVTVDSTVCKNEPDGGADGGAEPPDPPYGPTMFGVEGDDDDCKYHLKWSTGSGTTTASKSMSIRPMHETGG